MRWKPYLLIAIALIVAACSPVPQVLEVTRLVEVTSTPEMPACDPERMAAIGSAFAGGFGTDFAADQQTLAAYFSGEQTDIDFQAMLDRAETWSDGWALIRIPECYQDVQKLLTGAIDLHIKALDFLIAGDNFGGVTMLRQSNAKFNNYIDELVAIAEQLN